LVTQKRGDRCRRNKVDDADHWLRGFLDFEALVKTGKPPQGIERPVTVMD
jgi:hypothetical protein